MGGYDPCTGRELRGMGGGADIPVPAPIVAHHLIFLTNSMDEIYTATPASSDGKLVIPAQHHVYCVGD